MTSINPLHTKNSILARFLISLITIYQRSLSRLLGHNCRFYPSCSCYTKQAIAIHGALKGSMLGICRLSRCHPWHEGGFDPVPDTNKESRTGTDLERD